jgi:hypothetical protein
MDIDNDFINLDDNRYFYNELNKTEDGLIIISPENYELLIGIIIIFSIIFTVQLIAIIYYTRKSILICLKANNLKKRRKRKKPLKLELGALTHELEISPTEELLGE